MAHYAMVKRVGKWRVNGWDPLYFYRKVWYEEQYAAYVEWYNSLSDEEKERIREKKERECLEAQARVMKLLGICNSLNSYIVHSMIERRGW